MSLKAARVPALLLCIIMAACTKPDSTPSPEESNPYINAGKGIKVLNNTLALTDNILEATIMDLSLETSGNLNWVVKARHYSSMPVIYSYHRGTLNSTIGDTIVGHQDFMDAPAYPAAGNITRFQPGTNKLYHSWRNGYTYNIAGDISYSFLTGSASDYDDHYVVAYNGDFTMNRVPGIYYVAGLPHSTACGYIVHDAMNYGAVFIGDTDVFVSTAVIPVDNNAHGVLIGATNWHLYVLPLDSSSGDTLALPVITGNANSDIRLKTSADESKIIISLTGTMGSQTVISTFICNKATKKLSTVMLNQPMGISGSSNIKYDEDDEGGVWYVSYEAGASNLYHLSPVGNSLLAGDFVKSGSADVYVLHDRVFITIGGYIYTLE